MEFKFWVEQTVDIPQDQIPALFKRVNERFDLDPDRDVYPHDLIHQAMLDGLIDEPDMSWRADDELLESLASYMGD